MDEAKNFIVMSVVAVLIFGYVWLRYWIQKGRKRLSLPFWFRVGMLCAYLAFMVRVTKIHRLWFDWGIVVILGLEAYIGVRYLLSKVMRLLGGDKQIVFSNRVVTRPVIDIKGISRMVSKLQRIRLSLPPVQTYTNLHVHNLPEDHYKLLSWCRYSNYAIWLLMRDLIGAYNLSLQCNNDDLRTFDAHLTFFLLNHLSGHDPGRHKRSKCPTYETVKMAIALPPKVRVVEVFGETGAEWYCMARTIVETIVSEYPKVFEPWLEVSSDAMLWNSAHRGEMGKPILVSSWELSVLKKEAALYKELSDLAKQGKLISENVM